MHELTARLLKSIRKNGLFKPGDRIAAAVSGGADSVALLLLLLELRSELGIVLSVTHVNHKLRGEESDADQRFVEELCSKCGLELHCWPAPVKARESGIEAAARELRYECFRRLAATHPGMKIATGHTLDDQAETVLLRILRGTGIRGLAGIHRRIVLEQETRKVGEVIRPLLTFRRAELQNFLRERGQAWREDSTNRDQKFLRNRVRHTLLPMLVEKFGAAVEENLADLAEIARAEEEHWRCEHPEVRARGGALEVAALLSLPLASQRRLVRWWLEAHRSAATFQVIEDVLELACSEPGKMVEIAASSRIRRGRDHLEFESGAERRPDSGYEYLLPIPGEVKIPELGIRLQVRVVTISDIPESERACLLDGSRLPAALTVRNWRAGDRFWPAHSRGPKKVKELLSDKHLSGAEKKLWPVLLAGGELVWMRGFAAATNYCVPSGAGRAVLIREHKST